MTVFLMENVTMFGTLEGWYATMPPRCRRERIHIHAEQYALSFRVEYWQNTYMYMTTGSHQGKNLIAEERYKPAKLKCIGL